MEVDRRKILFGGKLGTGTADTADEDEEMSMSITRTVKLGYRVKSFRVLVGRRHAE